MLMNNAKNALYISLMVTLVTLFVFGFIKGLLLGTPRPVWSGIQMSLVGGAAASSAYVLAIMIPRPQLG